LKFQFIADHHQLYPVSVMCDALEVSVSGYYAWRKREPSQHCREDAKLAEHIKDAFQSHRCVYGSPRIHAELQAQGIQCARKRVVRLMRELELVAKRSRHRTVTTQVEEGATFAPNLLQRDFHADEPDQKWTSDTTYIWTQEGWLFLAVVLDLFSRMVVGWSMAAVQDAILVINALTMVLSRRSP
jgi:putative transposase